MADFEETEIPITLDQSGMILINDPELLDLVSGGSDNMPTNGMCGGTGGVNIFCPGGGSNAVCGGDTGPGGGGGGAPRPPPKPPHK